MKKLLVILGVLIWSFNYGQVAPVSYFTFDNANPLKPVIGTIDLTATNTAYQIPSGGKVGNYLSLDSLTSPAIVTNVNVANPNGFTVMFLFKTAYRFDYARDPLLFQWGNNSLYVTYPVFKFYTRSLTGTTALTHEFQAPTILGVNRSSWRYHQDGNWHHYALSYNPTTGIKSIYIDGLLVNTFTTTITSATSIEQSSNQRFILNPSTTNYQKVYGAYDEVAIFQSAISPNQVYQSYLEANAGNHYSNTLAASVPASPSQTAAFNANDYAKGHTIGSGNSITVTQSAIAQIKSFPLPRFTPGHTMKRLPNWMQPEYISGINKFTTNQFRDTLGALNLELAYNWNYYLTVSSHMQNNRAQYSNPLLPWGLAVSQANANPTIEAAVITYHAGVSPELCYPGIGTTAYVYRKNMPANHYMRNGSLSFIDINGNITANNIYSPLVPIDSIQKDGQCMAQTFNTFLNSVLTRPINYVGENGEVLPVWNATGLTADPAVLSNKTQSGLSWESYIGLKRKEVSGYYKNAMSPVIKAVAQSAGKPYLYMEYATYGFDGNDNTNDKDLWNNLKGIQDPVDGRYLSSIDYYPLSPSRWRLGGGAYKGLKGIIEDRNATIAMADSFYAPFVNAGYDVNEEKNVRPGQYLGNLKTIYSLGAIYLQPAYFNLTPNTNFAEPKGYQYQTVYPAYTQAVYSRINWFENSRLLNGDDIYDPQRVNNGLIGYQFYSGSRDVVTTIRQNKATTTQYLITSTLNKNTNQTGEVAETVKTTIKLNGINYSFNTRQQGSVYVLNTADTTFMQLDGWHEYSYPDKWNSDFYVQAELNDLNNVPKKTYGASGTDYSNAYTVLSYRDTATVFDTLKYTFQNRTTNTYYVWVKARSRTGTNASFKLWMDNGAKDTIGGIVDTQWFYYRYKLATTTKIKYTALTEDVNHVFKIQAINKHLEIDEIVLTSDSTLSFPESTTICALTVTTNASGPTSFCLGSSVTLTASLTGAGYSYLWSTGATAASINVVTSGTYTVTVYDANGCGGTSAGTSVTVNSLPVKPVITIVDNAICAGDSTLIGTTVYTSYSWSSGNTTQNFYAKNAGFYRVIVTNASGCVNVSDDKQIDILTALKATIVPKVSQSSCIGDTITATIGQNVIGFTSINWLSIPTTPLNYTGLLLRVSKEARYYGQTTDTSGCKSYTDTAYYKFINCDTCTAANSINSSEVTSTSVKVNWDNYVSASSFTVTVYSKRINYTMRNRVSGSVRSSTFTGLRPGTQYQYWVVSNCSDGTTKTSVKKLFTTLNR
jgi:hypothetical protein